MGNQSLKASFTVYRTVNFSVYGNPKHRQNKLSNDVSRVVSGN